MRLHWGHDVIGGANHVPTPPTANVPNSFPFTLLTSLVRSDRHIYRAEYGSSLSILRSSENGVCMNNSGNPEPIRTRSYTETEARVGRLPGNFGHSRSNIRVIFEFRNFVHSNHGILCNESTIADLNLPHILTLNHSEFAIHHLCRSLTEMVFIYLFTILTPKSLKLEDDFSVSS